MNNPISSFLGNSDIPIWEVENFGVEDNFHKNAGFVNPCQHHLSGMKLSPEKRINNILHRANSAYSS